MAQWIWLAQTARAKPEGGLSDPAITDLNAATKLIYFSFIQNIFNATSSLVSKHTGLFLFVVEFRRGRSSTERLTITKNLKRHGMVGVQFSQPQNDGVGNIKGESE